MISASYWLFLRNIRNPSALSQHVSPPPMKTIPVGQDVFLSLNLFPEVQLSSPPMGSDPTDMC